MPIRQHLALLADIEFFQVSPVEQQALEDFNQAFEHCLQQLVTDTLANMTRLKPMFKAPVSPQSTTIAKIKARILTHNLSHLKLTLPASVQALCEQTPYPYGLIKLAFHPEGEFFYQYLNDILTTETLKRLDSQKIFASPSLLYQHLNTLSREDFVAQITIPATTHPFYPALEKVFSSRGWQKTTLLCNDGIALERLAAAFIYSHLIKSRSINTDSPQQPLTAKAQALLECAAIHGSYSAAYTLTQRLKYTIEQLPSLAQSDACFNLFHREFFLPFLVPRYKTIAYLLLIEIQQVLFCKNTKPHHENFNMDTIILFRQKTHLTDIYRSLSLAKKDEYSCKNLIRLAFEDDSVAKRLRQLFDLPFNGIDEAMHLLEEQLSNLGIDHNNQPYNHSAPRNLS